METKDSKVTDTVTSTQAVNTLNTQALKANEIIKSVMKAKNITQQQIGELLGKDEYSAQRYFASKIRTSNMTVNGILEMLNVLGGELIIRVDNTEYKVAKGDVDANKKYRKNNR